MKYSLFLVATLLFISITHGQERNRVRSSTDSSKINIIPATSTLSQKTNHYVGQHFGGGIIFYITPDALHGLIAETIDAETSVTNNHYNWFGAHDIISSADAHSTAGKNFTDWRLPTKHELNILYLKKDIVGGFTNENYWSSLEYYDVKLAGIQSFNTGVQSMYGKNYACRVRAIRSF